MDDTKTKHVEISYNTKLNSDDKGASISVVSKHKFKETPENYAILRNKFERIEKEREAKEEELSKADENLESLQNDENRKIILITHFNVFMYATCYWIQIGTLPYLTKKLGADPVTFGQLQTVFAVVQLLGGPLYGRLGDLFGEKLALISAFVAAVLTYSLTAVSTSLPLLFLSRVPSVLLHVMQGSQMVVTVLSRQEDRAVALARLGFSYGIGMVVGPSIGGFVSVNFGGEHSAAVVSALGSCLSLVLIIIYLPNIKKEGTETKKKSSIFNVKEILALLLIPEAQVILLMKTICGVPIGILQSMFSVIAMEQFNLPADQNGMVLSYIGVLSMIMQGVGISVATKLSSERSILKLSSAMLIITYYLLSLLDGFTQFLILQIPLVCSLALINSILQSSITKSVSPNMTGTMLGLNMAVNSVIRTFSPTVGGIMLSSALGYRSIGYLGMFCSAANLLAVKYFMS